MRTDLAELERTIEEGMSSYREMGQALKTIRDRRLYGAAYGTWDRYCRGRWKLSGRYANQLIAAAAIAEEVGATAPAAVTTERHARELVRAPAALRLRIAEQLAGSKPTSAEIRHTVDALAEKSTGEKFAAATAAEDQARAGLQDLEREQTRGRIERLCGRLRELHATLPAAGDADRALDTYLSVVRGQPAARAA